MPVQTHGMRGQPIVVYIIVPLKRIGYKSLTRSQRSSSDRHIRIYCGGLLGKALPKMFE